MQDYEITGREPVYAGRAFTVSRVTARMPDGGLHVYDLVDHPDSVTVVPVDERGWIIFVRQFRVGPQVSLLELPAGVFNPEETPEVCAAREVREETGMAAGALELLGSYYLAPGYCSEKNYAFLATQLYDAPLAHDEDEFLEIEPVPVDEVFAMVDRGEIEDGKTLAALLLARRRLLSA